MAAQLPLVEWPSKRKCQEKAELAFMDMFCVFAPSFTSSRFELLLKSSSGGTTQSQFYGLLSTHVQETVKHVQSLIPLSYNVNIG